MHVEEDLKKKIYKKRYNDIRGIKEKSRPDIDYRSK